jgi:molecular chaperone DnaK
MAADNMTLGTFRLEGIPPAPRGVPQIQVTFDIDANGILKVTAQDKASGRSQHITITASSGLSKDEVEKMRQEAEAHASEDKKRRDLIEARNTADSAVYGAEKVLSDYGEKISDEIKNDVRTAVDEVKKARDGEDDAVIRKAIDTLNQAVQKIGAAVYEQTAPQPDPNPDAAQPGTEPGTSGSETGPDVVDGETKDH